MRFPWLEPGHGLPSQYERAEILGHADLRGSTQVPNAPREVVAQPAPNGLLVNWALPNDKNPDIIGWRIYSGDETNLVMTIADRGTRQALVPVTQGTTQNVLVSAIDQRGNESYQVPVQGTALAPTAALPTAPIGFNSGSGLDRNTAHNSQPRFDLP